MIGKIVYGLGKAVAGATKGIHEFLYQKGGDTGGLVTNPIDDIDDPGEPQTTEQVYWWVGGTTLLTLVACTLFGLGTRGRGKGGDFIKKLKRKFKR